MSSIVISGDTSGAVSIAAPAIAGTNTMTLAAGTGTLAPRVLSTAVASTSGTSIDFTNIPSWVTRITVMFNVVSTSGTSNIQIQLGSGSVTTSGYSAGGSNVASGAASINNTTGFPIGAGSSAPSILSGSYVFTSLGSNIWVGQSVMGQSDSPGTRIGGGAITLSGVLDRVRITTVGGTDTFDAGSINIMYE